MIALTHLLSPGGDAAPEPRKATRAFKPILEKTAKRERNGHA
jgi:hypothetical protein